MKKHILAIGAHADDLELSMGGTLLKYRAEGYTITYLLTTNNMSGGYAWIDEKGKVCSRNPQPEEEMEIRKKEAENAAKEFFDTTVIHLNCPQRHYTGPDGKRIELDYGSIRPAWLKNETPPILLAHENKPLQKKVADLILETDPEVIISLAIGERNLEHAATGLLALSARKTAKQQGYDGCIILAMTPAPYNIAPMYDRYDTFVDTTGFMEKKYELIRKHASQKPCPESLDFRDFSEGVKCGCETAEPFVIGEMAQWKTGPFTVELLKNRIYCKENYQKMFF